MKTVNFLSAFVLTILFASCSVTRTKTTKTTDIYGSGVIQKPVVVDLDVSDQKVSGTATASSSSLSTDIKSLAVNDALKKANADVLVEPKFETETIGGKTTATVTGWPASYKNFRSIKSEDIPLLQAGVTQKAQVY
ncbi:MAG: hypothetical protein ACKOKB_00255, partial [Bacteroidota bacterium]